MKTILIKDISNRIQKQIYKNKGTAKVTFIDDIIYIEDDVIIFYEEVNASLIVYFNDFIPHSFCGIISKFLIIEFYNELEIYFADEFTLNKDEEIKFFGQKPIKCIFNEDKEGKLQFD